MRISEKKFVCDLISLVANAIATGTIPEAEDYLIEKYQSDDNELIEHSLNVLSSINNYIRENLNKDLINNNDKLNKYIDTSLNYYNSRFTKRYIK